MKNKFIKYLDWDTKYFNKKCGKIILDKSMNEKDFEDIKRECLGYDFITISNENNDIINNEIICKKTKSVLVDINIQYEKKVLEEFATDENIHISSKIHKNCEILKMAKETFNFSRFFNDKNLEKDKASKIYYEWVKNSFEKSNKFFLILKENNKIIGFILFSKIDSNIVIELIAVDKNTQNKGIGKRMMKQLESYSYKSNIDFIRVGTQLNNIQANNFYQNNGFIYKKCTSIYHWWN